MTGKRFINVNHEIWQGNDVWCVAGGEHCADVIATALNEQNETINNLQYELMALMDNYQELKTDEKQLSISFIGYKQKVKETLQKHYNLTKKTKDYHIAMILEALANELGVDLND